MKWILRLKCFSPSLFFKASTRIDLNIKNKSEIIFLQISNSNIVHKMWKRLFRRSLSFQLHFASANKNIFLSLIWLTAIILVLYQFFSCMEYLLWIWTKKLFYFKNHKKESGKCFMNNWNGTMYILFFLSLTSNGYPESSFIFINVKISFIRFSRRAPIIFNKTVELQLCAVHFNFIMFN